MAMCKFCNRRFESAQGVFAHLKSCERYQDQKRGRSQPRLPQAPSRQRRPFPGTTPFEAGVAQRDILEELGQLREQEQAQTPQRQAEERARQEKTRKIVQDLKWWVVDCYPLPWRVPREAMAAAKIAIERELQALPILELPWSELYEIAAAVRDRIYKSYSSQQAKAKLAPQPHFLQTQPPLLTGAFVCPRCGETYDLDDASESESVCEECDIPLEREEDADEG